MIESSRLPCSVLREQGTSSAVETVSAANCRVEARLKHAHADRFDMERKDVSDWRER